MKKAHNKCLQGCGDMEKKKLLVIATGNAN
jgi:hypothetical protein